MRRFFLLAAALALYADRIPPVPPAAPVKKPAPPPTPREVAWRILTSIHLGIGKANPSVQPYLLLHLAENTADFNRKLALTEYRDAFSDSRIMETTYRIPLQSQIAASVATTDIPTALDLVRAIRPSPAERFGRATWDRSIDAIDLQILAHRRPDEAIELIKLVSTPGIFPNLAASNMIRYLPPADDRRQGIFGYAATCYRQIAFPGFSALVEDHWQTMPRALVVLAADAVADAADSAEAPHLNTKELTTILPVLREVDPPRADRLLSEHPEIQSASPKDDKADAAADAKKSFAERDSARALARLNALADSNPRLALFNINQLRDPAARQDILLRIAAAALDSGDSDLANLSLQQLLRLPQDSQRDLAPLLASLAASAGKPELASHYVDTAFDVAANLLAIDLNPDSDCGVNTAPKDWWPSTAAYRAAIHSAVSLFHTAAERYLARVPDSDLYLLMNVEFARALLGHTTTAAPQLTCEDGARIAKEAL
jgi:hypothetical protein